MRRYKILPIIVALGCVPGLPRASAAPEMPAGRLVQLEGPDDQGPPVVTGHPVEHAPPSKDQDSKKPPTRAESLDALFARLSKTKDADEAAGIAALIERFWMESGSDTADLLMARAMTAMGDNQRDLALTLLDKIVVLRPDWAEAWNKRATLRFLDNDDAGSMEDISHALALEPRHFGALSGLGFILQRNGLEKAALKALREAEAIYPESPDIRKAVNELVPDVEGRDL